MLPPVQNLDESDVEEPPAKKKKRGPKKHKRVELKDGMGYMVERSKPAILRTYRYSINKEPEKYYHSQLMLFYPWRKEEEILGSQSTYQEQYASVQDTVILNAAPFNKNLEKIDVAYESFRTENPPETAWNRIAPCVEEENLLCRAEGVEEVRSVDEQDLQANENLLIQPDPDKQDSHHNLTLMYKKEATKGIMEAHEYYERMYSLNEGQREIVMYLRDWVKTTAVSMKYGLPPKPFRITLLGSGGTGKSHIIHLFERDMIHFFKMANIAKPEHEDDPVILLTALMGSAAFNIDGLTLHSAFCLSQFGISDEKRDLLRKRLGRLLVLVCDETSMIGQRLFNQVHKRLTFIKGTTKDPEIQFGNISVLGVQDPYQLKPVLDTPLYRPIAKPKKPEDLAPLFWHQFQSHELTEIMRQKDDKEWAIHLNKIRTCGPNGIKEGSQEDIILQSRALTLDDTHPDYPCHLLHVYPRNQEAGEWNTKRMNKIDGRIYTSHARFSANVNIDSLDIPDIPRKTGNLRKLLELKIGARVKIPVNIDNKDGLSNGVMGTVTEVLLKPGSDSIEAVFVKFDSEKVGRLARQNKRFKKRQNNSIPITHTEVMCFLGPKQNIEVCNVYL